MSATPASRKLTKPPKDTKPEMSREEAALLSRENAQPVPPADDDELELSLIDETVIECGCPPEIEIPKGEEL